MKGLSAEINDQKSDSADVTNVYGPVYGRGGRRAQLSILQSPIQVLINRARRCLTWDRVQLRSKVSFKVGALENIALRYMYQRLCER